MGPPTDSVELAGLCAPTLPSYQQPTVSQSPLFVIRENQGRRRRAQDRAMSDSKHTLESKPHPRRAPQSGPLRLLPERLTSCPAPWNLGSLRMKCLSLCSLPAPVTRGRRGATQRLENFLDRPSPGARGSLQRASESTRLSSGRGTS